MWAKYKTRGEVDGAPLTLADLNDPAKVIGPLEDGVYKFGDFSASDLPSDGTTVATIASTNFNMTARLTRTGATDPQPGVWNTVGMTFVTP
jgi:hypothetical protein